MQRRTVPCSVSFQLYRTPLVDFSESQGNPREKTPLDRLCRSVAAALRPAAGDPRSGDGGPRGVLPAVSVRAFSTDVLAGAALGIGFGLLTTAEFDAVIQRRKAKAESEAPHKAA